MSGSKVKNLNVQHEQSTINPCVRWLHKCGETEIDGFEFRKLPRVGRGNEAVRRATLTGEEYAQLCRAMQVYSSGKKGEARYSRAFTAPASVALCTCSSHQWTTCGRTATAEVE